MGSSSSKSIPNTELDFQIQSARSIRDSLKTLQKSVDESNAFLSSAPQKILSVADGFTQVSACATHASPGATTSCASPKGATALDDASAGATPASVVAVEMACDFTESMRLCNGEYASQYCVDIQRDVGLRVRDLLTLATKAVQQGKTARTAYTRYAEARAKVESVEASAKKKGKDVNTLSQYTAACSTRKSAESNSAMHCKLFIDTYSTLVQSVSEEMPVLMQYYTKYTLTYQQTIVAGIAGARVSARFSQQAHATTTTGSGNQGLDVTQAALPGQPLAMNGGAVANPYSNVSEPATRGPSAPADNESATPQRRVKEDPLVPTPKSQQRDRYVDSEPQASTHEPINTPPATRANRSIMH